MVGQFSALRDYGGAAACISWQIGVSGAAGLSGDRLRFCMFIHNVELGVNDGHK